MVFWFGLLAVAGIAHILAFPSVLWALDPRYAVAYLLHTDAWTAFVVLGSVFSPSRAGKPSMPTSAISGVARSGSIGSPS